jgi:photosystem II stability/assembly factor-like uncharacterized protein
VFSQTQASEWTARASAQTRILYAVASTGTQLAAVGENGSVSTSPDGLQWTPRNSGNTRGILYGVAGRDSVWVAVGANGTILRSSNGGVSWGPRNVGTTRAFYGVQRAGELFVAVGSQGTLYTSPDGLDWTSRPTNTSTDLNAVASNGSLMVVVGDNGVIRTSVDGIEWTDRSVNTSNLDVDAVTWTGSYFVAIGELGVMLTSPDGLTWTSRSGPGTVMGIAWDGYRLVAVGANGAAWTSPDGNVWTASPTGVTQNVRAVVRVGTRLVAVGDAGMLITRDIQPMGPPPAPTLTSPAQYASDVPVPTKFRWEAVATATRYRIQVSRAANFSSLVLEDSSASPSLDLVLSEGAEFFWRVRAVNTAGESDWSEVRVFQTVPPVPSAPVLSYPAPFAENVPVSVALRWERTSGASSYSVQVSRSPDFSTLATFTATADTQTTVGSLEGNAFYYWRVRALNASGSGEYSTIRRFTTVPVTLAIFRSGGFTLHPGGLHEGARLRFALDKPEPVTICLLDARGREAVRVLDRRLEAGAHEVAIPSVADAGYVLDVRVGSRRESLRIRP